MKSDILTWYSQPIQTELVDDSKTGEALRKYRVQHGVTLRTVASKMRYSPGYISDLEKGRRHWSRALHNRYRDAVMQLAADAKGEDDDTV